MREFFHGWRRKVGCVALVMACTLAGAWLRSLYIFDIISRTANQTQHQVASADGTVYWEVWRENESRDTFQRPDGWIQLELSKQANPAKVKFIHLYMFRKFDWIVPYWSLVLPLTILAASLILVPSRKLSPTASQPNA